MAKKNVKNYLLGITNAKRHKRNGRKKKKYKKFATLSEITQ